MAYTPEQQALWDSIPKNARITPEQARMLGWEERAPGIWFDQDGHREGIGRNLPKKGSILDAKHIAMYGAALAGPAIAAQFMPAAAATNAATAGTAAGSAAVPAAGATVGPGVGFGAGGVPVSTAGAIASGSGAAGIAPAAAAGLSSGSFWGKLAAGIGGDLFQGYIANRGANKAADELIKSGDKQIAAYDKALGPYMDPAPLNALKFLSGLPAGGGQVQGSTAGTPVPGQMQTTGRTAPPNVPSLGTAVPRGTLASLVPQAQRQQAQQQTASSFVRMVSPDGEEGDVHPSQVQNAIQAGARPLAMGRG